MKERLNITLSRDTLAILANVANRSAYIDAAVEDRARRWREGLRTMRDARLRRSDIWAIHEATECSPTSARTPSDLVAELGAAQHLALANGHRRISAARWDELIRTLAGNWQLTCAVVDVLSELRLQNRALNAAIGQLPPDPMV